MRRSLSLLYVVAKIALVAVWTAICRDNSLSQAMAGKLWACCVFERVQKYQWTGANSCRRFPPFITSWFSTPQRSAWPYLVGLAAKVDFDSFLCLVSLLPWTFSGSMSVFFFFFDLKSLLTCSRVHSTDVLSFTVVLPALGELCLTLPTWPKWASCVCPTRSRTRCWSCSSSLWPLSSVSLLLSDVTTTLPISLMCWFNVCPTLPQPSPPDFFPFWGSKVLSTSLIRECRPCSFLCFQPMWLDAFTNGSFSPL